MVNNSNVFYKEEYKAMEENDIKIMCTARNCFYINKCYRHTRGDPDDIEQCYTDLSLNGCILDSGFDMYIPTGKQI